MNSRGSRSDIDGVSNQPSAMSHHGRGRGVGSVLLSWCLLALCLLAGCTSSRESFPGYARAEVWEAMVDVARAPSYAHLAPEERWAVRRNDVWVDNVNRRIELHRRLVRERSEPNVRPRREERTLQLQIALDPQSDPPTALARSVGTGLPAHAWEAIDRYFDGVWEDLGGRRDQIAQQR